MFLSIFPFLLLLTSADKTEKSKDEIEATTTTTEKDEEATTEAETAETTTEKSGKAENEAKITENEKNIAFLKKYLKKEDQIAYVACLYKLIEILTEKLSSNNIEYWADWGTLMGSLRHGAIIPWDDDGDLNISETDEKKLNSIKGQLADSGIELYPWEYLGYKAKATIEYNGKRYHPFVDIFLRHKCKNTTQDDICKEGKDEDFYIYTKKLSRKTWPTDFYYEKDLKPLKQYKLGPLKIIGPKNPNSNLEKLGEWDKKLKFWNHNGKKNLGDLHEKEIDISSKKVKKNVHKHIKTFTKSVVKKYENVQIIPIKDWDFEDKRANT